MIDIEELAKREGWRKCPRCGDWVKLGYEARHLRRKHGVAANTA